MSNPWHDWIDRVRPRVYGRKPPLVLINGLAEQPESWYRNVRFWRRHFDVYMPQLLVYDGDRIHEKIDAGEPITVDWLVEQLETYVKNFIQTSPVHVVASSLGGKVAVEYAVRYPHKVSRLVLLCPSGMGDTEQLPIIEGVRRNDMASLMNSVFQNPKHADPDMLRFYIAKFPNRKWRSGLLRTIRGTMDHTVRDRLRSVAAPTLFVTGKEDKVCDPAEAARAARELPYGHFLSVPNCGHAPQIEKAWLINRLVVHFLKHPKPTAEPGLTRLFFEPLPRATAGAAG